MAEEKIVYVNKTINDLDKDYLGMQPQVDSIITAVDKGGIIQYGVFGTVCCDHFRYAPRLTSIATTLAVDDGVSLRNFVAGTEPAGKQGILKRGDGSVVLIAKFTVRRGKTDECCTI